MTHRLLLLGIFIRFNLDFSLRGTTSPKVAHEGCAPGLTPTDSEYPVIGTPSTNTTPITPSTDDVIISSRRRRKKNHPEQELLERFVHWSGRHGAARHIQLVLGVVLFLWMVYSTTRQWRSRSATPEYLRCAIMALRSCVGALVMFMAASSPWIARYAPSIPFMEAFQGLPTFILLAVQTRYGKYLASAWHAILGSLLPLLWIWFLNFLMPGGASKAIEKYPGDAHSAPAGWLYIGYSPLRALGFLLLFVYLIAVSSIDMNAKFYGLMMYAGMAPAFINPNLDPHCLRGIIYYIDQKSVFHLAWNIYSSGQFMVFVGVIVGGLCLMPAPQTQFFTIVFGVEDDRSNLTEAHVELAALARKIGGTLKNLMLCFREEQTAFELHAMSKVVYSLNDQLKEVEANLGYARWETCTKRRRKKADDTTLLLNMFKELKWILISIISCIREKKSGSAARVSISMISSCFEEYLQHTSEAIGNLVQNVGVEGPERSSLVTTLNSSLALASGSLDEAEGRLHELTNQNCSAETFSSNAMPIVFIDCLRKWHVILHKYANMLAKDRNLELVPTVAKRESWHKVLQRHGKALKITVGFAFVMAWSERVGSYHSRGVLAYIMCSFGKGIGSKVHEILYRWLGITSGSILAGIPFVLYVHPVDRAWYGYHGHILYLLWALTIWIVFMYCILRDNAYSGSAVLALVWGGASLVRHMQVANGVLPVAKDAGTFYYSSINEVVGMITVLVVELAFIWLSGTGTARSAVRAVSKVLDDVRNVMQCMIDGQPPDAALLLTQIEKARAWNAELQGVDRLWSVPWKHEFVEDLLDQCSSIYVVASSMQDAAFKLEESVSRKILQELVPPTLPERIKDLQEAVDALLKQKVPRQKEAQEVLRQKSIDHKMFCSVSCEGSSVASFMENEAPFPDFRNTRSFLSGGNMVEHLQGEADYSAAIPIIHGLQSMQNAVKNIEVLLQMQVFLSFGRWDVGGALDNLQSFDFHQAMASDTS